MISSRACPSACRSCLCCWPWPAAPRLPTTTSSSGTARSSTAAAGPGSLAMSPSGAEDCRRRRAGLRDRHHRGRCEGPGRRARLHQHAELGRRVAARRRPLAERHPPGRHARGLRRGRSMGPLNDRMKQEPARAARATSSTTSPGPRWRVPRAPREARHLDQRRVVRRRHHGARSTCSATTIAPPTPAELDQMRALVRTAMEEGALGVGSSLIYAPGFYAEDRRADRAVQGGRRVRAACTSRTCAARATACSRRSTS